jgi:hypothetical protein
MCVARTDIRNQAYGSALHVVRGPIIHSGLEHGGRDEHGHHPTIEGHLKVSKYSEIRKLLLKPADGNMSSRRWKLDCPSIRPSSLLLIANVHEHVWFVHALSRACMCRPA